MNFKLLSLIAASSVLAGCTSIETPPDRVTGSAYESPATLETLNVLQGEIALRGTVISIGSETWYAPTDEVTGNAIGAVYYRPIVIEVSSTSGTVTGRINLQVLSDIDPSPTITELAIGDEIVAIVYSPEDRDGVMLFGIDFLGKIDISSKEIDGLTDGDEQDMPLVDVIQKLGL